MAKILVAGPNPAWQKVMVFGEFRPGQVNRASQSLSMASGKGINAAKVLRRLGHEVTVLQIVGGINGKRVLEACGRLGLASLHVEVPEETRLCVTLADGRGETSEIIEPFRLSAPAVDRLLDLLPRDREAFDGIALLGTVPPGAGLGLYDAILERLQPRVSVIDAWQDVSIATFAKATGVKMNRSEYGDLEKRLGAPALAGIPFLLTAGGGEACVLRSGRVEARIRPPGLGQVANAIGAGDTVTAGLTHFLLGGEPPVEAFRRALAMGSASCLKFPPAEYSEGDYQRLLAETEVLP
jgi:fructose-1-phosphate kinase PfkB-like protein